MTPPDFGNENSIPQDQLDCKMSSIESGFPDGTPREDLITTAAKFLIDPRVKPNSESEQRAFLQRKGLTPVEIDMAFQRRMSLMAGPAALAGLLTAPQRSKNWADFFHRLAMSVAVFSSASYALYWFFKTYVEPKLGPNQTELIMKEILEEMRGVREELRLKRESDAELQRKLECAAETLAERNCAKRESDAECMAKTMKAVAELRDEMASLKKILLARNQFAATPTLTGVPVKIPSWQQNHASTSSSEEKKVSSPGSEEENPEKEESAPDSGVSPDATSSDGEAQAEEVKDKVRSSKKKRGSEAKAC